MWTLLSVKITKSYLVTILRFVAALIHIPRIRSQFSFANLPPCRPARLFPGCVGCEGSLSHRRRPNHPAALLLRPGRNHSVAARVCDRLPQMLVLISEDGPNRTFLC